MAATTVCGFANDGRARSVYRRKPPHDLPRSYCAEVQ